MTRYFATISQDDLREKTLKESRKSEWYVGDEDLQIEGVFILSSIIELVTSTPRIEKDLSKVNFDQENCFADEQDKEGWSHPLASLIGFHTLDNGLTFLGVVAGGDWEEPLCYIIYWDGKKLRAYIPTDGNTWNKETKTAYGSEEEASGQYKDYWDKEEPIIPVGNPELILSDIRKRIQPRG